MKYVNSPRWENKNVLSVCVCVLKLIYLPHPLNKYAPSIVPG